MATGLLRRPGVLRKGILNVAPATFEVQNNTTITAATLTVTTGLWLVMFGAGWSNNNNGYRKISIGENRERKNICAPASGEMTHQSNTCWYQVVGETEDIILKVNQNSGSTLLIWPYIGAIRLY